MPNLAPLGLSYSVFLGVLPVRDVTDISIRNVATQPKDRVNRLSAFAGQQLEPVLSCADTQDS